MHTPFFSRSHFLGLLLTCSPLALPAAVVTWDVSDQNLITPPSEGDETNSGNTAIGVWLNLFSGQAYVIEDVAGAPGLTDLADGRYQLRWNVYWRDNEDGLPSTEVVVQGAITTTRLLGTNVAVTNAARGSPERLGLGVSIPTGTAFYPASYVEMAGAFGVWQEQGRGFLGLYARHPTLPQFHYGYADVTILEDGRIRLNGFAYNDTPNTTLTTAYIGAVAPLPASGLSVTSTTATTVSLAWTDHSDNETGFKIQRRGPGEEVFTTVATTNPDVTAYTDEGLAAASSYTYRVVATTGLDAAPTNEVVATTGVVTVPPAAPSNFAVAPVSPTSLRLSWVDNATDEVGYRIERRTAASSFSVLTTTGPSATTYLDLNLLPGIEYFYRITATNGLDSTTVTSPASRTFSTRESTGVEAMANQSPELNGAGVTVGLWDLAPARSTHTEFAGAGGSRVTNVQGGEASADSRSNHTTHAVSLIAARGADATALGLAPAASVQIYDINADVDEFRSLGMEWPGQAGRLQVANASYGPVRGWTPTSVGSVTWSFNVAEANGNPQPVDPAFGAYTSFSAEVDAALADRPYLLLTRPAGNDRDDGPSSGDLVYLSTEDANAFTATIYNPTLHPASDGGNLGGYGIVSDAAAAKNTLTVGALYGARRDLLTGALLFAGDETDFSNWGPTQDGRIKPDLVAPGVNLRAAGYATDDAYVTLTGSSQAAPLVAGAAALVVNAWDYMDLGGALRASTLKALLIHTADDLSTPGPDPRTGWGLINAKAAIDLVAGHVDNASAGYLREGLLSNGGSGDSYLVWADGSGELRATLAWTDPATVDAAHPLVNDLELRLINAAGQTFEPYVLPIANPLSGESSPGAAAETGPNHVDTVEQIRIAAPVGYYWVQVSAAGGLSGGQQAYSLIVSGAQSSPENPGPKPVELSNIGAGELEIRGGQFALGTSVQLSGPGSASASAVTVTENRVRFRYDAGAVSDGLWLITLTQPDGLQATIRWPVGAGTPQGYETWLQTHFTAGERADATITAYDADADRDGYSILAAYALGASSGVVPTANKPTVYAVDFNGQRHLEIAYTRLRNADVVIAAEIATSLAGAWTPLEQAGTVEVTNLGNGTERVRVRMTEAASTSTQVYVRVRVSWQ
ncbi:MAG: S8 family serine peptidase [Verrucomicrobiota bacterium JB022]|nr:S8 family serine peptidase [Verrucomicrobiota bacterium JB022]